MKTRIVALVAVAGFAGVASAQNVTDSLSVMGATQVGPNAYEVDISGGDAGSLTVVLSSQLNPEGSNFIGIASVRGNVNTANAGVDVAFSTAVHIAPYNLLATTAPGASLAYQPGFNSSAFPSAGAQPTAAQIGNGVAIPVYSFVIDFSNATDGGTITVADAFTQGQAIGSFIDFFGSWFPTGNANVNSIGAEAVTITFVPAPGALALLGLGGLVAGRRRR